MPHVIFDLETVRDTSLPPWEPKDPDAFPPPSYHQIVAIGFVAIDGAKVSLDVLGPEEAEALPAFLDRVGKKDPTLVGWNSRGFDLPVLAARALAMGLQWSWFYRSKFGARYRYSDEETIDVKDQLGDFGAARSAGLDVVAKSIGLPGKMGVDGTQVADMIAAGKSSDVMAYCLCDAVQTTGVFLRFQMLRGAISRSHYQTLARALLDAAEADPRTKELAARVDHQRFLLTDAAGSEKGAAA